MLRTLHATLSIGARSSSLTGHNGDDRFVGLSVHGRKGTLRAGIRVRPSCAGPMLAQDPSRLTALSTSRTISGSPPDDAAARFPRRLHDAKVPRISDLPSTSHERRSVVTRGLSARTKPFCLHFRGQDLDKVGEERRSKSRSDTAKGRDRTEEFQVTKGWRPSGSQDKAKDDGPTG